MITFLIACGIVTVLCPPIGAPCLIFALWLAFSE